MSTCSFQSWARAEISGSSPAVPSMGIRRYSSQGLLPRPVPDRVMLPDFHSWTRRRQCRCPPPQWVPAGWCGYVRYDQVDLRHRPGQLLILRDGGPAGAAVDRQMINSAPCSPAGSHSAGPPGPGPPAQNWRWARWRGRPDPSAQKCRRSRPPALKQVLLHPIRGHGALEVQAVRVVLRRAVVGHDQGGQGAAPSPGGGEHLAEAQRPVVKLVVARRHRAS